MTTPTRLNIRQTLFSVAAAFFGVQSSNVRKRDFEQGNPIAFMIAGALMTAVVAGIFYAGVQGVLVYSGL